MSLLSEIPILQYIAATQSPTEQVRRQGELELKNAQALPNFISALFEALCSADAASQSLSLSITLKQRILHGWDTPTTSLTNTVISEEDKALIKRHLPVALAASHISFQTRTQLRLCISEIIDRIGIEQWPELVPTSLSLIRSNDINHVTSGIFCFLAICRSYKLENDDEKLKGLDQIITHAFPDLLSHAQNIINDQNEATVPLLLAIVKSYYMVIFLELPAPLQEEKVVKEWCTLFVRIVMEKRIPPEDWNEDMVKLPWGKVTKRAYSNLTRLYTRYGCPSVLSKTSRDSYLGFANMFVENLAPTILEQFFNLIKQHVSKDNWLAPEYLSSIILYLEKCIMPSEMWKHIKDVLPELLAKFLYPLLCLTEEDIEMYSTDPKDYLFKRLDHEYLFLDSYAHDLAAASFILELVKQRPTGFTIVMDFIRSQLSPEYVSDPRQKEAIFRLIGIIAPVVARKPESLPSVDSFMLDVVLPEFRSPHGFLQARACHTAVQFKKIPFEWKTRQELCVGALNCLKSPDIPVKAEAALVLLSFLKHEEVRVTVQPHVKELIPLLIRLNQEVVDIDGITSLIEDLIDFFPGDFVDIAESFTGDILEITLQRVQDLIQSRSDEDVDSEENNIQTILTALQPLNTLLHNLKPQKTVIDKIGATILPLIAMVVHHKLEDLYTEISSLAETCVFVTEAVTPTMWTAYNHLISLTVDGDTDVMIDLVPTLETYILYGDKSVTSSPDFLDPLIQVIGHLLRAENDITETKLYVQFSTGPSNEITYGCRLAELIMLCARGRVDHYVQIFIQHAWAELVKMSEDVASKGIPLLDILIHAIYYDARLAIQVLGENMPSFLSLWFNNIPILNSTCQKKVSVAALAFLLDQAPIEFQTEKQVEMWAPLLPAAAKLIEALKTEKPETESKGMNVTDFLEHGIDGLGGLDNIDGEVGDDEDLLFDDVDGLWGGNLEWDEEESQVELILAKLEPLPLLVQSMTKLSPQAQEVMLRTLSPADQTIIQSARQEVEEGHINSSVVGAAA